MNRTILSVFILLLLCAAAVNAQSSPNVLPNIDFTSQLQWVSVPEGSDDAAIDRLIEAEVERLIMEAGTQPVPYETTLDLYENWLGEKQTVNDRWRNRLLTLTSQLRTQVSEVSSLQLDLISDEKRIDVIQTQIDALRQSLENDSLNLQRYLDEETFLRENLELQLYDISYMVVVLGKREMERNEELNTVLQEIDDRILLESVSEVCGTRIVAETAVANNQLVKDYIQSDQTGFAQVIDSYTNDFATRSERLTSVRYRVQAIDVRPFRSIPLGEVRGDSIGVSSVIYIVDDDNLDQIWHNEGLDTESSREPIRQFMRGLLSQANRQNLRINAQVTQIYADYEQNNMTVQRHIHQARTAITSHQQELEGELLQLAQLRDELENFEESEMIPARTLLQQYETDYRNHISHRITFVDKTDEGWLTGQQNELSAYQHHATTTHEKVRQEFRDAVASQTALAVNYQLVDLNEQVFTYRPRIRAFTVLWLTLNELSMNVSYIAGIGYQLEHTADLDIREEDIFTETQPVGRGRRSVIPAAATPSGSGPVTGMDFVTIPGGTFEMGSPTTESERSTDEGPQHMVTIQPFQMMTTEVTQQMWYEIMGTDPFYYKNGGDYPAEMVSWDDAQLFITRLNDRDPGKGYRLPSEAEWEYACRAGTDTRYYNGNKDTNLGEIAWFTTNSSNATQPVAQLQPNAYGLYDMHGNVWEWVADQYHSSYKDSPADGSAWVDGTSQYRVFRGGGASSSSGNLRAAYRATNETTYVFRTLGFRLVRNAE